jgi:hypothetical protein
MFTDEARIRRIHRIRPGAPLGTRPEVDGFTGQLRMIITLHAGHQ